MTPQQLSEQTKSKADNLLRTSNILKVLSIYGNPQVIGSYYLDVMVRKELDINLTVSSTQQIDIAKVLSDIHSALHPISMDYRNRTLPETKIRVDGHWIKLKTLDNWNFDIWIIGEEESKRQINQIQTLRNKINTDHKSNIVELKALIQEDAELRNTYFGARLYDAVINHRVITLEDYKRYLKAVGEYDAGEITFVK